MRVLKISAVALGLLAGLPSLVSLAGPANAQVVGSAASEAPNREILRPERRALWERSLVADADLDAKALAACGVSMPKGATLGREVYRILSDDGIAAPDDGGRQNVPIVGIG